MPKQTTPSQLFARLFAMFIDKNAPQAERDNAERKLDEWLKKHSKTRADISAILVQAAADDAAAQPPPPPSDPRDGAPHPFDDPKFTPADLVEGIVSKYLCMRDHVRVIYVLWIIFTHVYTKFAIAPRVALNSEDPDSGKTTALEIARCLVYRPNPEALGTGPAVRDFVDEGPCTLMLDELDQLDAEARRSLHLIWNLGHKRGAKTSLKIEGKRKIFNVHAPMIAAGIGNFLGTTQMSRAFDLKMEPYDEETKPEREWNRPRDDEDAISREKELNAIYSYLRHWTAKVKLDLAPQMPSEMLRRFGDNVNGLVSVADSCGPAWGERARKTMTFLFEKTKAERPQITLLRHSLEILDTLELDQIGSIRLNQELKRLDLPDAKWTRYRGPSGMDLAHPLEMHEQAALFKKVGIASIRIRPLGQKQCHGFKRGMLEEALRKHAPAAPDEAGSARGRLRLITPSD